MTLALLDILTGQFADDQPISSIDPEQHLHCSIISHLNRLLNCRQGSLPHLPDYGLPDVAEIYQGLPYSLNRLLQAIKFTIEKYEPRLHQVSVIHSATHDRDYVLRLKIQGKISNGERIIVDTYFSSVGHAKVEAF
jgi:type VI secretion system protein